ncbi:MAG: prolipoprotein diacylglyceryl transferase [Deltaproteobacteria bacterium]|nr:MAG: prolipoprotein diacylglyceryl transferase [Deltaproteobacteria bacterium]
MHPVLFQIGPLTIYTYGLFVASGLILGISLALKEAKREGYDSQVILDLVFYLILTGIIGSRVFFVAQNFSFYKASPLSIFKIWEGGLVFHGGLVFAIPVGWILVKRQKLLFWKIFDLLAPSLAIGQALGRIGCFCAGCCYGAPTELPWAVTFNHPQTLAPQGIPLHPTQLYAAAANFLIFIILMFSRQKIQFTGQLSCLYLCLHSVFRFIIELFRGDPRVWIYNHTISLTQGISILVFLAAIIISVLKIKSKRKDLV